MTLFIRSLIAESSSGDLRLDGALMFGESGGYDLKYRSTIDLSELRKWWARTPPARGRVELSGSVTGVLTDPQLTFDIRARELRPGRSFGRAARRNWPRVPSTPSSSTHVCCGLSRVSSMGEAASRFRDGDRRSRLAGEWSLPRLRALASRLNLDASRWPALRVSGTANLSWPGPMTGDQLRWPGTFTSTCGGREKDP